MKKLMIMLAAVAMAVGAQAANVKWTCTNVYAPNGTDKNTGVAYFVNAAILSQDSLASLNGASAFTDALSGMYSWTPSSTTGSYGATATNADLGFADSSDYNAYLLIFDTATITDESKYYVTAVKSVATYSGAETASISFMSQATSSKAEGAWQAVAVPEPTSGLLMLVGLAGLALRRRRS